MRSPEYYQVPASERNVYSEEETGIFSHYLIAPIISEIEDNKNLKISVIIYT